MNFVHYINQELNEYDIRLCLRDSCDMLRKSIDIYKSAKRVYIKRSVFNEYGYDEQWLSIMLNLWRHWRVRGVQEFEQKIEDLTSLERDEMIKEIIASEVGAILSITPE